MLKTKRLVPSTHGTEDQLPHKHHPLGAPFTQSKVARDVLREGLFEQVTHLYQQQQVVEDVVLQLKAAGYDVDSVFQRAYVLLGIVAKEDKELTEDDNLEEAPLDEVSIEGGLAAEDAADSPSSGVGRLRTPRYTQDEATNNSRPQTPPEGGWAFSLDFNRLEYSVSQPNSAEEQA